MNELEATHLIIDRNKVSKLAALLVALMGTTFMIGYFRGKRDLLEHKQTEILQDSLADQACYGLTLATHEMQTNCLADFEDATNNLVVQNLEPEANLAETGDTLIEEIEAPVVSQKAYAQLAGFGSKKNAQKFYNKLKNKNYPVIFKERPGKGNKFWYQIVTEPMAQLELVQLVDKITKEEKIKPVIIHLKD